MISSRAEVVKKMIIMSHQKRVPDMAYVQTKNAKRQKSLAAIGTQLNGVMISRISIAGVKLLSILPSKKCERTVVYLHGGGFVYGLSVAHVAYAVRLAKKCSARVLLVDYSLSPGVRYPVALNEIKNIWCDLVKNGLDVSKTIMAGDSSGASLAISSMINFRNQQIAQPVGLVLFSPAVDLTMCSKSYKTNNEKDIILDKAVMGFFVDAYTGVNDKTNPLISPIYADLSGLSPILLQVGSDEVLLDECREFIIKAQTAGTKAAIKVGDGMWHNWHLSPKYMPESSESLKTVADFIADNC